MNDDDLLMLAIAAPNDDDNIMALCAKIELLAMGTGMVRAGPRRRNGAWNRLTHHLGREEPGTPCTPRSERPRCGARTRSGDPCKAPVVWDDEHNRPRNGRCRVHGGLSTGPKGNGKAKRPAPVVAAEPTVDLDELLQPPDIAAFLNESEHYVDEVAVELAQPLDLELPPIDVAAILEDQQRSIDETMALLAQPLDLAELLSR